MKDFRDIMNELADLEAHEIDEDLATSRRARDVSRALGQGEDYQLELNIGVIRRFMRLAMLNGCSLVRDGEEVSQREVEGMVRRAAKPQR